MVLERLACSREIRRAARFARAAACIDMFLELIKAGSRRTLRCLDPGRLIRLIHGRVLVLVSYLADGLPCMFRAGGSRAAGCRQPDVIRRHRMKNSPGRRQRGEDVVLDVAVADLDALGAGQAYPGLDVLAWRGRDRPPRFLHRCGPLLSQIGDDVVLDDIGGPVSRSVWIQDRKVIACQGARSGKRCPGGGRRHDGVGARSVDMDGIWH